MRAGKEMIKALRRVLSDAGASHVRMEYRRKHARLHYEYCGTRRYCVVSASPSDVRATKNQVALLRRDLRQLEEV